MPWLPRVHYAYGLIQEPGFFRRFMVLLTSKSFLHGSKTIGVDTVDVPVGPACVLVCAVIYSA